MVRASLSATVIIGSNAVTNGNDVMLRKLTSIVRGGSSTSTFWGGGGQTGAMGLRHRENSVCHTVKYSVFGIKPTYNQQMFILDVQLHSSNISFFFLGGVIEDRCLTGGRGPLTPSLRTASVDHRAIKVGLTMPRRAGLRHCRTPRRASALLMTYRNVTAVSQP